MSEKYYQKYLNSSKFLKFVIQKDFYLGYLKYNSISSYKSNTSYNFSHINLIYFYQEFNRVVHYFLFLGILNYLQK
jgi:hypothetical protein